jgi:hypothetical protein
LTRAAPIDRAPQFRTFGVGYVLEYTLEFRAYRDSAYLLYVLLLLAPGPLVTLLEGQFSLVGRQAYSAKAGAEYLNRRREDVSDFIPADVVENRTDFGIFERAPQRGINYAAYPATCSAMRAQRNLGFHLSASFLCRKPQFNEPPEGLRPRRQVFLLPAPSVDALNHCSV